MLEAIQTDNFQIIFGMLTALGYEFTPSLSNWLMSEKKLSFANVEILLEL